MTNTWPGCYDLSWKDTIVPAAFAHPAKMSRGLLRHILDHAFEQGWVSKGSIVCDPFGGIGSTAIEGAYRGLQVITCELEDKFVTLAKENMALHARHWTTLGCPQPVVLQGDSRKLCELVRKAGCVVGSPPFSERQPTSNARPGEEVELKKMPVDSYGTTPGQLGAMKAGRVEAVVGSPPFTDGGMGDKRQFGGLKDSSKVSASKTGGGGLTDYGHTPGQLAALPPGSVSIESGDTFWSAARLIVEQCYQLLPPGGHAVWVCKDFVRNKQRVPFSDDWLQLCKAVGFRLACRHQALLVKTWEEATLFEGTVTKSRERKSFFRRLAEKKGSPRIDWEDVLCVVK